MSVWSGSSSITLVPVRIYDLMVTTTVVIIATLSCLFVLVLLVCCSYCSKACLQLFIYCCVLYCCSSNLCSPTRTLPLIRINIFVYVCTNQTLKNMQPAQNELIYTKSTMTSVNSTQKMTIDKIHCKNCAQIPVFLC